MVVSFDTPTANSNGILNNSGSSAGFVQYMEKEKELLQTRGQEAEQWFSPRRDECHPAEVRTSIDRDHQGIGKKEGKFATGSINPTEKEWNALGNTEKERIENFKGWIQKDFTREFANNYNKKDKAGNIVRIEPESVKIYYKVEFDRYYTGKDEKVKKGLKRQGESKEGFNVHCHFIVARKTEDGKNRISPTTNNRKEFDRDRLTHKVEKSFDMRSGYERPIKESYEYAKTMKNGTAEEKINMLQISSRQELQLQEKQKQSIEKSITREKEKQQISRGLSR